LNELAFLPGLFHSPTFLWLSETKKSSSLGLEQRGLDYRISNHYPFLEETLNKMKTRTQTGRIARTMEKTPYYEQHGFCRNRGIATAMVPLLETIQDAEKHVKTLQLLSIDF
jgi:hypothetical protein